MKIILYTKTGCPWCKGVLDLFEEKDIEFEERDARKNPDYLKELIEKSGQDKTPTLEIDGKIVAVDSDADVIYKILLESKILK